MSISTHNSLEAEVFAAKTGAVALNRLPNNGLSLKPKVNDTIRQSQEFLLSLQKDDGHWVGEMLVDVTLVADFIALMHGQDDVDPAIQARCVNHILTRQGDDGGWNIYPGGSSEINATVKAYFGLKLAGFPADDPRLVSARDVIFRLGGIGTANTYTKIHLALFGQYPWNSLPTIPVELILLPNWFWFNIYEMSSWSRAMVVPLSVLHHFKAVRSIPDERGICELQPPKGEEASLGTPFDPSWFTLRNFFLWVDKAVKVVDSWSWRPLRKLALKRAENWILERMGSGSDGMAALFPGINYSLMVLGRLGYEADHPMLRKVRKDLLHLLVDDDENDEFRVQPCVSPVWDTAITAACLVESGIEADDERLQKCADWLISKEISDFRGDWKYKNPVSVTSGWAFEYQNKFYPDVDDTFEVLIALSGIKGKG